MPTLIIREKALEIDSREIHFSRSVRAHGPQ